MKLSEAINIISPVNRFQYVAMLTFIMLCLRDDILLLSSVMTSRGKWAFPRY